MTIKEIAKLAGVSHMTVSRVINNSGSIHPDTRKRVLEIIQEHNYVPSASAKALISGKTHMIGVLIMYDLSNFPLDFFPPILEGISTVVSGSKYRIALYFDQNRSETQRTPDALLSHNQLDGLLVLSIEQESKTRERLKGLRVPIVVINQPISVAEYGNVVTNETMGAFQAVEHLINLGHRDIAMLRGDMRFIASVDRFEGYKKALAAHSIPLREELLGIGNLRHDLAYQETLRILQSGIPVSAVFASNDPMAMGTYRAAEQLGLSIPKDLSVVGYDNQQFAEYVNPPLTTIRKHRRTMGEKAAGMMLEKLNNDIPFDHITLDADLVIRGSTAPKA